MLQNLDKKKSFILYGEQYDCFKLLTIEERGTLITALFEHKLNLPLSVNLSSTANMAFVLLSAQIDRDSEKYLLTCEKRKQARENRYNQMSTSDNKCNQMSTSVTDTETETDTDTETETETETDTETETETDIEKEIHKEKENPLAVRFARFWAVYPKKVGKGAAEKAFMKIKPSDKLTQTMVDAVEKQKYSREWTKDNGQYIPNPATWLNQGRWEDEGTEDMEEYCEKPGGSYRGLLTGVIEL